MAREFSKAFYNSKVWRICRNAYFRHKHGICEECDGKGEEVHHKTALTPANINNPEITLNWANLQLLCRSCHELIEEKAKPLVDGLKFTEDGDIMEVEYATKNTPY